MKFCENKGEEGGIWVDRSADGKADLFHPCSACEINLAINSLEDRIWHDLELCYQCNTRLEVQGLLTDLLELDRPYIGDEERFAG